ncbi:hypothetical protein KIPB_001124 [Kipferlia bialata]|uniref:Peptidase M16C associated domain-containing protein n=1 Tax=Kipferlia bialata TaxID=797122 RepID=A0A9K3CRN6_9EUKA|nr:hypothetical protein KIPB_001124 [Kipferlia bialata]|eukprot:g1124.t1
MPKISPPQVVKVTYVEDITCNAIQLVHIETGARVLKLESADVEKMFIVAFRTPPPDDTGLPHILEHSVLCGSKRYPLKEPFTNLLQSSLQTFLNAFTYSDKTCYPISSRCLADYTNLSNVYLDAVFQPNITESTFQQEGWHLHVTGDKEEGESKKEGETKEESEEEEEGSSKDCAACIKGVVYNEMQGAFSDALSLLYDESEQALFPDTPLGNCSGGAPEAIRTLTYERFTEFHRTYYHPANASVIVYGDCPLETELQTLAEHLAPFKKTTDPVPPMPMQTPFKEPTLCRVPYPGDNMEKGACLGLAYQIGDVRDQTELYALTLVDTVLNDLPGSVLKEAVQKVVGSYHSCLDTHLAQPMITLVGQQCAASDWETFEKCILDTLKEVVANPPPLESFYAALSSLSFSLREPPQGEPRGLQLALRVLRTWLYDHSTDGSGEETDMCLTLMHTDMHINALKAKMESEGVGYFVSLIEKYFVNNTHRAGVIVEPKADLEKERAAEMEASIKAMFDKDPTLKERARAETAELLKRQSDTDSPEALETLPKLSREDLPASVDNFPVVETTTPMGIKAVSHDTSACGGKGLAYVRTYLEVSDLATPEEISSASLLSSLLFSVASKTMSYAEMALAVERYTGGIAVGMSSSALPYAPQNLSGSPEERYRTIITLSVRMLSENTQKGMELLVDALAGFDEALGDRARLLEVITEMISSMETNLLRAGNALAAMRAKAHFSGKAHTQDCSGGLSYLHFLRKCAAILAPPKTEGDAEAPVDTTAADAFVDGLKTLWKRIFVNEPSRALVSVGVEPEQMKPTFKIVDATIGAHMGIKALPRSVLSARWRFLPMPAMAPLPGTSEVILSPSAAVSYCAQFGKVKQTEKGEAVSRGEKAAPLKDYMLSSSQDMFASHVLSTGYLWDEVRVKGGAYGSSCIATTDNMIGCTSYRDPNVTNTLSLFRGAPQNLREQSLTDEELLPLLIGTIGSLQRDLSPAGASLCATSRYICGRTPEIVDAEYQHLLAMSVEDLKQFGGKLEQCLGEGHWCVLCSEGTYQESGLKADVETKL